MDRAGQSRTHPGASLRREDAQRHKLRGSGQTRLPSLSAARRAAGLRTAEGQERIRQARTITCFYSASAIAARRKAAANYRRLRTVLRDARTLF